MEEIFNVFNMGRHANYVWSSYFVASVLLGYLLFRVLYKLKKIKKKIKLAEKLLGQ